MGKVYVRIFSFLISFLASVNCLAAPSLEGIQTYQKNMHLSPEHKRKLADDITRYRNADNLWDVLREEFTLPHYENIPAVQEKIEWFMNNQDYLLRSATRAAPYLYYILQQVRKRHLPTELVLLPIVESGYNPFSLSHVGAAGIWQLMPGTATGLGVKRDMWYDGRRDVIASTRAALNYLAYLQTFFEGNWLLAIAAYNTGEGNVLAAMKRNIRDGRDTDFWSLPVAQETRDYVPSLLALAVIITHPDQYPIYFPPVRNAPYLAQIDVGAQINIKYAAGLAGISLKQMQQLNSGFKAASTKGPSHKLVLPIENVEQFTENLARSPLNNRPINWSHYQIKSGDTIVSIAKKFNTTPNAIRKLNHLNAKANLRRGSEILIPQKADDEVMFAAADTEKEAAVTKRKKIVATASIAVAGKYVLQPGDTVYMVRATDTIKTIAYRFHIKPEYLQAANGLVGGKKLPVGKQLIIPTHFRNETASTSKPTNKLQPGDTIYMVRKGDTIEKIAQKFKASPAAIRIVNLVDNNSLAEGEKLIIPTHLQG